MILEAMIVGAILSGESLDPVSDSAVLCKAYPPQASPECRECMDNACEDYNGAIAACGGNADCELLAGLRYEIQLLACTGCQPVMSVRYMMHAIPQLRQDWVIQRLCSVH